MYCVNQFLHEKHHKNKSKNVNKETWNLYRNLYIVETRNLYILESNILLNLESMLTW